MSTLTPLAQTTDVQNALGRALTADEEARVGFLLDRASQKIRAWSRLQFTQQLADVRVLRIVKSAITLPQRPVTAVSKVQLIGFDGVLRYPVPFQWDGLDKILFYADYQVLNLPEILLNANTTTAEVTYDHGYAAVPDDVVDKTAELVARCLLAPLAPGVQSVQTGPMGYRIAAGYGALPTLTDDDKADLKAYAPRPRVIGGLD